MTEISDDARKAAVDIFRIPRRLIMSAETERREYIIQAAIDAATDRFKEGERSQVCEGCVTATENWELRKAGNELYAIVEANGVGPVADEACAEWDNLRSIRKEETDE